MGGDEDYVNKIRANFIGSYLFGITCDCKKGPSGEEESNHQVAKLTRGAPTPTAVFANILQTSETYTSISSDVDGLVSSTIEVTANKCYFVHLKNYAISIACSEVPVDENR